ncbi:hypothetical protein COV82_00245 [Candidatus Peregrinibacteria bacterium CG11_big_fil_rev_8_21_14_0_20_46_8]|nr:MAG: hypothetical protein COV82_00245 [Candidatus Peregrinibacteria bacterium CG11_big_fil_rev_8_21_14_0_20_46_8]
MSFININEAATISGKSIQTIRRMIKQKKVRTKQQKTPQGFNYLIDKDSLEAFIAKQNEAIAQESAQESSTAAPTQNDTNTQERPHRNLHNDEWRDEFKSELGKFTETVQKLVDQNAQDKSNFFGLIKTFQDRIITLEDQIKLLKEPETTWWQFWK